MTYRLQGDCTTTVLSRQICLNTYTMADSKNNFVLLYELYANQAYTSPASYTNTKEFIVNETFSNVKQEFVPCTIPQIWRND